MNERASNPTRAIPTDPVAEGTLRGEILPALLMLAMLSVITGLIYPLVTTGIAQALFPRQANGSLIVHDGRVVGSSWIGQSFAAPGYFWGRLSGTAPAFNAGASSGSNYGPLNPALADMVKARVEALRAADPEAALPIPVDLVTASGSGLDPHISVAAAEYQIRRVAQARGLSPEAVRALVTQHTTGRFLGLIGEPVVNVLEVNLALDATTRR
jgi:K+-transporting ATPase ATPase C chain